MSLKSKIKGAVDKAFAAAGDLVLQATFEDVSTSAYDFATGSTTTSTSTTTVDIILLDTKKAAGEAYTIDAIIKHGPDLDNYDSVTIDGVRYAIVSFTDSGYHVDLVLKKEK